MLLLGIRPTKDHKRRGGKNINVSRPTLDSQLRIDELFFNVDAKKAS